MHDDRHRHERLRRQVADQAVLSRRLRLESEALRAAASAIVDDTVALRLVARGRAEVAAPPMLTRPPEG